MDFTNALTATGGRGGIAGFDDAVAAAEFEPLPPGVYITRVSRGEYCSTKAGAEAYRVRWEVTEGPHAGKSVIRTWTFGPKALPFSKRDLSILGLATSAQLLSSFPPAAKDYICRLVVALQKGDDGREFNDVKRIELLRIDDSPAAAYMLPTPSEGGTPPETLFGAKGDELGGIRK